MKNIKDFTYTLFWSEEDGEWFFKCNEMPGITTFGESMDDAFREGLNVMIDVIEILNEEEFEDV